jgi:hypothetical protein
MQRTLATVVRAFRQQAKAGLEAALGRPLADGETLWDPGCWMQSMLRKDVWKMNRSVRKTARTMGMATSRATEVLESALAVNFSNGMPSLGKPEALRNLNMAKVED